MGAHEGDQGVGVAIAVSVVAFFLARTAAGASGIAKEVDADELFDVFGEGNQACDWALDDVLGCFAINVSASDSWLADCFGFGLGFGLASIPGLAHIYGLESGSEQPGGWVLTCVQVGGAPELDLRSQIQFRSTHLLRIVAMPHAWHVHIVSAVKYQSTGRFTGLYILWLLLRCVGLLGAVSRRCLVPSELAPRILRRVNGIVIVDGLSLMNRRTVKTHRRVIHICEIVVHRNKARAKVAAERRGIVKAECSNEWMNIEILRR